MVAAISLSVEAIVVGCVKTFRGTRCFSEDTDVASAPKHNVRDVMGKDAMSQSIPLLSLAIGRNDSGARLMIAMRAILICLIALFTTAVWGVILHFGTRAVGVPIGGVWLATALVVIFVLVLLMLGMAVMASDGPDQDGPDPPPGA